MKKTVQIVTIPMDKQGWSKNDIVMMNGGIQFPLHAMESNIDDWQAQQLLVLSNDKLKKGDVILSNGNVCDLLHNGEIPQDEDEPVKIIASYPQIEGTLPISQEFVQQYVKSQGKAVVYMETEYKSEWAENLVEYAGEPSYYHCKASIDKAGNAILSIEEEVTDPLSKGLDYIKENNIQLVNKPPVKETTQETVVTAAMEWYKKMLGGRSVIKPVVVKAAFIEGAAWQEEQFANSAVEFFQWATNSTGNGYTYPGKEKAEKLFNNEYPTNEQLYELWQQTKKQ